MLRNKAKKTAKQNSASLRETNNCRNTVYMFVIYNMFSYEILL